MSLHKKQKFCKEPHKRKPTLYTSCLSWFSQEAIKSQSRANKTLTLWNHKKYVLLRSLGEKCVTAAGGLSWSTITEVKTITN